MAPHARLARLGAHLCAPPSASLVVVAAAGAEEVEDLPTSPVMTKANWAQWEKEGWTIIRHAHQAIRCGLGFAVPFF